MNLLEILKNKKLEAEKKEEYIPVEIKECTLSKEEAEKAALCFFLLFTKFYSRDLRIGHGQDFLLLKDFLLEGYIFKEEDYPKPDIGLTIFHEHTFKMLYRIPPNVLYTLYKDFRIDKKSKKCENCI